MGVGTRWGIQKGTVDSSHELKLEWSFISLGNLFLPSLESRVISLVGFYNFDSTDYFGYFSLLNEVYFPK